MIVDRLEVRNVRNIESAHLDLDPGVNLLIGPNGAGKTALLEAVHLLIRGRSFRTNRAESVVRQGCEGMEVGAACQDRQMGVVRLSYVRDRGRVELRRDSQPVRQASLIAALLPIQLLLPNLGELVFGSPANRRQWLDWGAFHVKHEHAVSLRKYNRALRHRNALLRANDPQTLAVWTEQVVAYGEAVASDREAYFERVEPEIRTCLSSLGPDLRVSLTHERGWSGASLGEALHRDLARDGRTGNTHSGPHRGDMGIRCGAHPAALTLSRGQGKIVASALRLGQAKDLLVDGERSLFLIDDIGAELDAVHNERFYSLLDGLSCQVVATSAQPNAGDMLRLRPSGRLFHVKQGRVEQDGS